MIIQRQPSSTQINLSRQTVITVILVITYCYYEQLTYNNFIECLPTNQRNTTSANNTTIVSMTATTTTTTPSVELLPEIPTNIVTQVDMKLKDNTAKHHTAAYRQMSSTYTYSNGPNIVLRRGEFVSMLINLKRPYEPARDRFRIEASFGPSPSLEKGTLIYAPLVRSLNASQQLPPIIDASSWSGQLTQVKPNGLQLEARLWLPANCSIGIWRFRISAKLVNRKELNTYLIRESIYVLFNAWSKDDTVFLNREDGRQEYVLNEVGKVYMGTYNRPTGTRWTYGQFSEYVLPGVMMLLDRTRLDINQRSDVVKVSRAISATMNSHDDGGLLVGNWSGNYLDGNSPWSWSNSATIFERYFKSNGRPVKFGQCWVFGGLTTTALRTLGIPARTITNFVSAHDTDLSLTVDQFNSDRGEKISGINGDSIWNFHVWSDAWMLREDLPSEYSGWQAIDATPQEKSMDIYQLGPASVEAVRQGKVTFAYDVGFVYSEVNADVVTWRLDSRSPFQWRRLVAQTDHVGRTILTKQIGKLDDHRYGVADAEDITLQYKYREGSREERNSYNEASKSAGLDLILQTH